MPYSVLKQLELRLGVQSVFYGDELDRVHFFPRLQSGRGHLLSKVLE